VFNQKSEAPTPQEMMMSNPDMMMNMMKGNITGFLPQVALLCLQGVAFACDL
jgi:hypothetical protein